MVRKMDGRLKAMEIANGDYLIQKNLETVERLPLKSSGEVLVNMENQEELEGYKHEDEEACDFQIRTSAESPLILDLNSKRKRADLDEFQKSKTDQVEESSLLKSYGPCADGPKKPPGRRTRRKKNKRQLLRELKSQKRTDQVEESSKVKSYGPCADGPKKPPSRSARRKKIKRQLFWELKSQKENHTSSSVPVKAIHRTSPDHDMENEIIPTTVCGEGVHGWVGRSVGA